MSNPITYYQNLITSEHRDKPNFMAWVTATLQPLDDATTLIINTLYQFFDIEQAIGIQLDTIGQILGQSRTVNFQPSDGSGPTLNDVNYRLLLKARVAQNQWKGNISDLQPVWQVLFPGGVLIIKDNQDMSMSVAITGNLTLTERDLVRNGYIVPKPQGVYVNYYFGGIPFFGFDIESQYISGFDVGCWAKTQEVTIFGFDQNNSQFSGFDKGYLSD